MPISPGTRLGPYEVLGLLGAGAMGEVYRARDARLAREVAIKVLPASFAADPERLQRFETEARAAGALNHPNIVAVYDTGVADGVPYVVEELLDGETLRQGLGRGPLSPRRVLDVATQVAKGLAAAHDRGIVHRDLKPENLFVTRDGRAKILDFGLAKVLPRGQASSGDSLTAEVTATGMLLGTAGYMAPEQVRGEPADSRSDLFALGVVMHEMLGGVKPFSRGSAVDTLHAILHTDPPELSGVPPALARIVTRCLEKEPVRRFQSAHDLAFALEALSDPSGVTPAPALAGGPARSRAVLGRLVGGVAIVAAVALGWFAGSSRAPDAPHFTRLTFRTGSIGNGRIAPDGRSAVFDASWDGRPPEVFQVPFDFPASRPLGLSLRRVVAISPANELALLRGKADPPYFRDGGVFERMTLSGGSPRAVVDSVYDGDFSPDGSTTALLRFSATHSLLEYPQGHLLYSTEFGLSFPRVSPDGRTIAVVENPVPFDDRGRVVLVDRNGKRRVVTQDFETIAGLAWSADGKQIWFAAALAGIHRSLWSVRPGRPARERLSAPTGLVLLDVAKNDDALLLRETGRNVAHARFAGDSAARDVSWFDYSIANDISADGRAILFDEESESAGHLYAACLRRAEDAGPVRLGDGIPIAFSPDGAWALTFVPSVPQQVVLLPTGPGQPRKLSLGPISQVAVAGSWMPDGRHVLVAGSESGKATRLWLLEAGGGPPKAVSPEGYTLGSRANHRVSADGRSVLCANTAGEPGLFDLESQEFRVIPNSTDVRLGGLLEGGRRAFGYPRGRTPTPVWSIDLETGERRLLFELPHAPFEDLNHVRLAADPKAHAYTTSSTLHDLYRMRGLR